MFKEEEEEEEEEADSAIGLIAPSYEADTIPQIGNPWSTGLFDCHENQTNGNIYSSLIPLNELYS